MGNPVDVAHRHDEAWNTKDVEARKRCCSPDIEVEMPGGMYLHGLDQVRQVENAFWEALPDSQIKLVDEFVVGDSVITEGVMTGTQTGPFRTPQAEMPPSGNSVSLRYASIKRVAGDTIVSEHLFFDQMEFMMQLGAFPAPSA